MNQKSAPASTMIRTGSNRGVVGGNDWLVLAAVICVATAIRLHGLSAANLWLDEANSWQVASRSWPMLIGDLRGSPVGPLYFVLLKVWISAFGDSAFALRAFSVLSSIALIPVVYAVGRKLLSREAGLLGAALVALSPLELYFAQEARMYMLTSLVAALALWAYASWRSEVLSVLQPDALGRARTTVRPLVLYTLAAITLLFSHPVAGTLLVAFNLDALIVWWRTRWITAQSPASRVRRNLALSWVAAQLAVALVLILYLAFLHLDSAASSQAWRGPLGFERSLRAAMLLPFGALAGPRYLPTDFWFALNDLFQGYGSLGRFLTLLIIQPLTLLVLVLALDAAVRDQWGGHDPSPASHVRTDGRRLLALAVVVPLLFDVGISTSRALETERYFLFVVAFLFLLLADGVTLVVPALRKASLAVLALAIILGTRSTKQAISRDSDYRSTAALIEREAQPGDRVIIQPREMNAPLRFYLRSSSIPVIGLAANASAGRELATMPPARTWVVIDYRSPLYALAPQELAAALRHSLLRDAYTSDASAGVRVALVDTRAAPQ